MSCLPVALVVLSLHAAPDVEPLTGTWEFDAQASSDLDPVLDFFEVGFVERKLARSATPTQVVKLVPPLLEVTVTSSLRSGTKAWTLDEKKVVEQEFMGHTARVTSRYEKGAVVGEGTLTVKGEPVRFSTRRFVEAGRMVIESVLEPKGRPAITVRRVFKRKA